MNPDGVCLKPRLVGEFEGRVFKGITDDGKSLYGSSDWAFYCGRLALRAPPAVLVDHHYSSQAGDINVECGHLLYPSQGDQPAELNDQEIGYSLPFKALQASWLIPAGGGEYPLARMLIPGAVILSLGPSLLTRLW